jgi:hypothetical protein
VIQARLRLDHRLTEEASLKMLRRRRGAGERARLHGQPRGGRPELPARRLPHDDGARHFSIITTRRKAITSASQKMPTGYAPER